MTNNTTGVRLESNGAYWLARWIINGAKKHRSLGAKAKLSRRAALQACRQIEREHTLNPASARAGHGPALGAWCAKYLELRNDLSEGTSTLHSETMRYLQEYLGADRRLDKISRLDAADWRTYLASKPGKHGPLTEASVCRHIRTAKVIFERAVELDLISSNPFDREKGTAPEPQKDWRQLAEDEVRRLIDATPSHGWKALFALCAYAGLRRGEAMRLTWNDVHWERRRITVRAKGRSATTKSRTREVLLEKPLETILLDVHESVGVPQVADVPVHNMHRNATAIIRQAGFEAWASPFHTLRKWRATSWRAQYPEHVVDAWLGHSLDVARKHYAAVPETYYGDAKPHNLHALAAQLKALTPAQRAEIFGSIHEPALAR